MAHCKGKGMVLVYDQWGVDILGEIWVVCWIRHGANVDSRTSKGTIKLSLYKTGQGSVCVSRWPEAKRG
jgi:hypothetical protein